MTPRVRQYAAEIAAEHQVTVPALLSQKWAEPLATARRQLYRRLKDDGYTSGQIGRWLGRDGSTVRAALTKQLSTRQRPVMARDAVGRWTGRAG